MYRGSGFVLVLLLFLVLFYFFKYFLPGKSPIEGVQTMSASSYDFTHANAVLAKGKRILILAPHEDDETLMCAGIITHALANGADVKVGVITNGDKKGRKAGLLRIRETMKAMEYLGLHADNIIFFGYGDTGKDSNSFLNRLYNAESDTMVIASNVGTTTYGAPEAPEYHYLKFGDHGLYNRANFRQDLETVIKEYNPDHIFVTSLYDAHPDHAILYRFTIEAIINIKRNNPEFAPVMHEYIIHTHVDDVDWPPRDAKGAPLMPFAKPDELDSNAILNWEKREIFTLPIDMQKMPRSKNKKYIAISKYRSQRPSGNNNYLYAYVKQDEFFWTKDFANLAFLADVSVSSENVAAGQLGVKAIDGIADGYPRFPGHEWATMGETEGAWIKLRWSQTYNVDKIILFGRPHPQETIISATLNFSDGSMLKVGPLPNDGSGYEISFPAKTIEWVRLTIDAAAGASTGLSEFEVYQAREAD